MEEYPPAHLDLSKPMYRAVPNTTKRTSRSKRGPEDKEALTRAAMIFATLGTCGLFLPIYLIWEAINHSNKRMEAKRGRAQSRAR